MNAEQLRAEFKQFGNWIRAEKSGALDGSDEWPTRWRICSAIQSPGDTHDKSVIEALCKKAGELLPGNGPPMDRWFDYLAERGEYTDYREAYHADGERKGKPATFVLSITSLVKASELALLQLPNAEIESFRAGPFTSNPIIQPHETADVEMDRAIAATMGLNEQDTEAFILGRLKNRRLSSFTRRREQLEIGARIVERIDKQQSNENPPECYVTLIQMASIVNRAKRTLERLARKPSFPPPEVQGMGGKPSEWKWSIVRPILEAEYDRHLPERFPADRFIRT